MLKDTNKKILYLSYDGVLEPLGSSQVLNYVIGLAKSYNFIHLKNHMILKTLKEYQRFQK